MTAPARIHQADIERAAKAARSAGWPRARMVIDLANCKIEVFLSDSPEPSGSNDWDDDI